MLKKYFEIIFVLVVLVLAIFTRLYKLGEAPHGFYVDEAGQGYSAYSILKTGKDEFGKEYPIVFRSLTDFKTPVYIYLIVPFIPVFGLNEFTVRFPSFLFSIMTIPVLYFLIKHLSGKKYLAMLSILLLSISPWHILFGRTNFECNVALFFFLSGVLFFYKALNKPIFFLASALMFAIAIPAYHSQRIITPLTIIALALKYHKEIFIRKNLTYLSLGGILGLLISLPTLSIASTPGFLARASGLNIFTHVRQMPSGFLENYNGIFSFFINGSWFLSIREFLALYLSYLSPRYMFILGDYGPRSSFPELSTFFVWQAPLYIWGLYILIKNKKVSELKFLILALLFISPLPAAVTRDPYSTIRSLPLVVPQIIIIALAIEDIYQKIKSYKLRIIFIFIFVIITIYSLFKLYSSIVILNEFYRGKYWDYGWKEAVEVINEYQHLPIVIDNARGDPYLHIAFFLGYDPVKYQKENIEVSSDEYYTNLQPLPQKTIGKIVTRPIVWKDDLTKEQLLIGDELAISPDQIKNNNLTLIKEIKYPSGEIAIRIVKVNPK